MEDLIKHYTRTNRLKQFRIYILISLFTIDLTGIADVLLVSELQYKFGLIRYGFLNPLGLSLLWVTYQGFFRGIEKYFEALLAVVIFLEGIVLVWIHGQAMSNSVYFFKYTLLLHVILMYFLSNLRFSFVSILGLSVVLAYNLLVMINGNIPFMEIIEVNGVLIIGNLIGIAFYIARASLLKSQTSFLAEIVQKNENVIDDIHRDILTKLYNRDSFQEIAEGLYAEENLPITVVIGDVNGLRMLNDSLGFKAGDELLLTLAQSIQSVCRPQDLIARMGGDEFAIFLLHTNRSEAEKIVKQIVKRMEEADIQSLGVSISFGMETIEKLELKFCDIYKMAEKKLFQSKLHESPSARGKVIQAILHTLHEKNKREGRHSRRVSKLCEDMGRYLRLSDQEIKELKSVGLLHDIGKVAIEEDILNKPGRLTFEEYSVVKGHSAIGFRILNSVNDMADIAQYVLCHHERWDGKGYPRGLKEREIPLQSRIIAIADAFDAMTSDRSYRKGLPQAVAIEEIKRNSGTQFDPGLVEDFIEMVSS